MGSHRLLEHLQRDVLLPMLYASAEAQVSRDEGWLVATQDCSPGWQLHPSPLLCGNPLLSSSLGA